MKIKNFLDILDQIAPFFLQAEYDNSGLQFADLDENIHKIFLCLDVTKESIQEAFRENCNVILSHHPLFFHPIYNITKQDNPVSYQLIYQHMNLISFHTNYDLADNGLNDYVGKLLDLNKVDFLESSSEKTFKLAIYVPDKYQKKLLEALFEAGAGNIGNYSETSFTSSGKGSFKPSDRANPFIGKKGEREIVNEVKIETVFLEKNLNKIIKTIYENHPYEEPAFDIYQLSTKPATGIGLIAKLNKGQELESFGKKIKKDLGLPYLRIIKANDNEIQKVALCTGSGGSLIKQCINKNVDLFITGDIDHHEALKAKEMGLNIIDIEHYYTEKYFVPAIKRQLIEAQIPENLLFASKKMTSPFQIL